MTKAGISATLLVAIFLVDWGQIDKPAPRLELNDVDGRPLRLGDHKGKVVLINFWATWCAPCRAEIPDLIRWQREYKSRGLQVIGITYPPEELAEVRKFIKTIKINYPIALGDEQTKAMFDKGETLPVSVVIDKNGVVRDVIQGIIFPEEFEQKVKPFLR